MGARYPEPPRGPALRDHGTQAALRRYRNNAWLAVLVGVVLLAAFVPGALFVEGPARARTAVVEVIDTLIGLAFFVGLGLVVAGLVYGVRAGRWRRLLAQHEWQAFQYRYRERLVTRDRYAGGRWQRSSSVRPELTLSGLPAPAGPRPQRVVRLNETFTRWGWRLRLWRQAPSGVAWLVGDPSDALIVALPGTGRLFEAHADSPDGDALQGSPDGA